MLYTIFIIQKFSAGEGLHWTLISTVLRTLRHTIQSLLVESLVSQRLDSLWIFHSSHWRNCRIARDEVPLWTGNFFSTKIFAFEPESNNMPPKGAQMSRVKCCTSHRHDTGCRGTYSVQIANQLRTRERSRVVS